MQKKKVLVLDESADIRSAVSAVLREHNIIVAGARNIEEARSMAATGPVQKNIPYDLLILDIQPGKLATLDFLRSVRGEMASKVPALLIGAAADANLVQEAAKIGVSGFLLKPFTGDGLWKKIKPLLAA